MSDPETVAQQHHATLSLLQAMYPMPGELILPARTQAFLEDPRPDNVPDGLLDFELNVNSPDAAEELLSYTVSLRLSGPSSDDTATPRCSVYLRQPTGLTRAEHAFLLQRIQPHTADVTDDGEYILDVIACMPGVVEEIVAARPIAESSSQGAGKTEPLDDGPLERVWFWFPTLSSKEKRRDIVEYAREASLTGFVLAGKPALLCVEGGGAAVDRYMARIKKSLVTLSTDELTRKVTERLRLSLTDGAPPSLPSSRTGRRTNSSQPATPTSSSPAPPPQPDILYRQLPPLIDISDEISRYGTYAHRAEMSEVRKIVDRWGVGEEMGRVLMQ